jgi:hypothetical protein
VKRTLVTLAVAVIVSLSIVAIVSSSPPKHHSTSVTAPKSVLAKNFQMLNPTLSMISARVGFAWGNNDQWRTSAPHNDPKGLYRTSDGGATWHLQSRHWATKELKPWRSAQWLVFTSSNRGWMFNGRLFQVTHAGEVVTQINFSSPVINAVTSNSSVFIERAATCYQTHGLGPVCQMVIESHALRGGSWHTWPTIAVTYPVTKCGAKNCQPWTQDAYDDLLAVHGSSSVMLGNARGGFSYFPFLTVTTNQGRSWHQVGLPTTPRFCGPTGGFNLQLTILSTTHWLDLCELSGGMNQGSVALEVTVDGGRSWTDVAGCATELSPCHGGLTHQMVEPVTASNNGRVLFVLGDVGGIWISRDGGAEWTAAHQGLGEFAGGGGVVLPMGPSGAVVVEYGQAPWFSTNGTSWRES